MKHCHAVGRLVERVAGRPLFIGAHPGRHRSDRRRGCAEPGPLELAHVARATTVSALTASIAHEVNQPLSGIITNASTCLRMLEGDEPGISMARARRRGARSASGNRAADVVARMRELFGKREFTVETVDLNEATREVLALSSIELQRHGVVLQPELAAAIPDHRRRPGFSSSRSCRVPATAMLLTRWQEVEEIGRVCLQIRTERATDDERVRVSVRDAGVGVDPGPPRPALQRLLHDQERRDGDRAVVSRSIIKQHRAGCGPNRTRMGRAPLSAFAIHATGEGSRVPPGPRRGSDERTPAGVDRGRRRLRPRVVARLAAAGGLRRGSVPLRRGVSGL